MTTLKKPARWLVASFGMLPKWGVSPFKVLRCLLLPALFFSQNPTAYAQSANWISNSNGNWSNGSDWSTGSAPGSTNSTTDGDTATFNNTTSVTTTIDQSNQNIGSIVFGPSAAADIIGSTNGNPLLLSSGGMTNDANAGTSNETINAPLVLEPASSTANGTYTFTDNNSSHAGLNFKGAISGGSTTGTITLSLTGSTIGFNTISGNISNGGAAGGLGISVSNVFSFWNLTGTNTYSGPTSISSILLELSSSLNPSSTLV